MQSRKRGNRAHTNGFSARFYFHPPPLAGFSGESTVFIAGSSFAPSRGVTAGVRFSVANGHSLLAVDLLLV